MFKTRLGLAFLKGVALAIPVAFALCSVARGPEEDYSSSAQMEAKRSPAEFVPDGDLTKSSWKHAQWVEFDNDAWGKSHYPQATTRAASVWTDMNIYFAFWSRYDSLNIYEGEDPKPELATLGARRR